MAAYISRKGAAAGKRVEIGEYQQAEEVALPQVSRFVTLVTEPTACRDGGRGEEESGRERQRREVKMGRKVVVDARSSRKTPAPSICYFTRASVRGNPDCLWVFPSVCKKRIAGSATRGRARGDLKSPSHEIALESTRHLENRSSMWTDLHEDRASQRIYIGYSLWKLQLDWDVIQYAQSV